jgi:hypothetical protein
MVLMKLAAAVALAFSLSVAAPLLAQGQQQENVSADRLPISLDRIKRGLRESQSRPVQNGLKVSYYVTVVADNPAINLFKDFDTLHGLVPRSAPTHQELFEQVTPKEFRAPAADVLGAAVWLGSKLAKKK